MLGDGCRRKVGRVRSLNNFAHGFVRADGGFGIKLFKQRTAYLVVIGVVFASVVVRVVFEQPFELFLFAQRFVQQNPAVGIVGYFQVIMVSSGVNS